MDLLQGLRAGWLRPRGGRPGSDAASAALSWIGDERIAISGVPSPWAAAACFAARVLEDQPQAGVLIHCSAGRRRSVMVADAVLRLRGHGQAQAAALVLRYRPGAQLVPAYVRGVEQWLAAAAR